MSFGRDDGHQNDSCRLEAGSAESLSASVSLAELMADPAIASAVCVEICVSLVVKVPVATMSFFTVFGRDGVASE
jgi:hypothetical protein